MSKKAILSALLVSSALLGTTAAANAATSAVKPENKLVTVEKKGAKLYKNSKLDASTTAKVGTVYKVNGYRVINKKHYYRVYQQDKNGKNVYKGYLLNKDAKDLKAGAVAKKDRFVGVTAEKAPAWKNLYFTQKVKNYNGVKHSSNFEVKRTYKLGDKTYYSMYRGEKWMGYMDASQVKVLTPEAVAEDKQAYKVVEDWNTYNDIYFTEKGTLTKGDKVTVKRIYTFETGRQYGSLYNAEGKWIGYANMKALAEDKVADEEMQKAIDAANDAIKKAEEILSKAQASKESKEAAQKVIDAAKETIKNGNLEDIKKIPAQIAEAIKALKPGATTIDIQKLQEAIEKGKEVIKAITAAGIGSVDQPKVDELNKAIADAEKVLGEVKAGNSSTEAADKAVDAINKAIANLESPATTVDVEALQSAIKDAEGVLNNTTDKDLTNRAEIKKAVEEGKKVLEAAKKGEANGKEVQAATKAIEDALNNAKLNKQALVNKVQEIQKLASNVYMTKDGEMKFVKAMTEIMNMNDTGMSFNDSIKANNILDEAKAGLEKQPNEATGKEAAKLVQQVMDLGKLPNKGEGLTNIAGVKAPFEKLNQDLEEMKKDTKKVNNATVPLTKAEVEKDIQALKDALAKVTVNTKALQTFIDAAKALAAKDKDFSNDKAFQEQVTALEDAAKDSKFANLTNIMDKANAVYQTMLEDLQTVLDNAAKWNNNQVTNNPKVNPVDVRNLAKVAARKAAKLNKEEEGKAVPGEKLSPEKFANSVLKANPNVGDYYTSESYGPFADAIVHAKALLDDAKASNAKMTNQTEASAQVGNEINAAMKALAETQENLSFDFDKLLAFSQAGNDKIKAWGEKDGPGANIEPNQNRLEQMKMANAGFWYLGYKNVEGPNGEQNKWNENESYLAKAEKDTTLLEPTKFNAEVLATLVYAAENGYHEYIQTVTVGSDNTVKPIQATTPEQPKK